MKSKQDKKYILMKRGFLNMNKLIVHFYFNLWNSGDQNPGQRAWYTAVLELGAGTQ